MKIIYFRESAIQSIVSDTYSFAIFVAAMAMNHYYLGDSTAWAVILFMCAALTIASKGNKRRRDVTSWEELERIISEEKRATDAAVAQ